ncbi:MAG: TenA family transcriptional regulator [Nitrospiraceae bacterium]
MGTKSSLRERLEAAVMERHCANHPLTEKWAAGQVSRNAMMGWGIEQYHWISNIYKGELYKAANTPLDVQYLLLKNYLDEVDPERPHLDIILRFAGANGADIEEVKRGRGLPTTEAWVTWFNRVCKDESFIAAVAATNIGTESQSPLLYGKVLPALRKIYRFKEEDIEHFWLHEDADTEHGGRGFGILDRYCTTPELQEMAIHYARESAKMRWFFFDGIYLHYEMGYKLR